jgi:hypothetical protein
VVGIRREDLSGHGRLVLAVPADELRFQNDKEIYGVTELPVTW